MERASLLLSSDMPSSRYHKGRRLCDTGLSPWHREPGVITDGDGQCAISMFLASASARGHFINQTLYEDKLGPQRQRARTFDRIPLRFGSYLTITLVFTAGGLLRYSFTVSHGHTQRTHTERKAWPWEDSPLLHSISHTRPVRGHTDYTLTQQRTPLPLFILQLTSPQASCHRAHPRAALSASTNSPGASRDAMSD